MTIEKAHHKYHDNQHNCSDSLDNSHTRYLIFILFGQVFNGRVNYKLSKLLPGLWVTSLTGRKGHLLVFERDTIMGPVAVSAIC